VYIRVISVALVISVAHIHAQMQAAMNAQACAGHIMDSEHFEEGIGADNR